MENTNVIAKYTLIYCKLPVLLSCDFKIKYDVYLGQDIYQLNTFQLFPSQGKESKAHKLRYGINKTLTSA